MPQVSLPDKLSELGDRIHDAADDARLPDEVRERLDDAAELLADVGERLSDAGSRIGSEVGERLGEAKKDMRWPALALPAALRGMSAIKAPRVEVPRVDPKELRRAVSKLELPEVTIGRQRSGPPVVPLVILAAVAGGFVGWWLATSSYTSARVRSAIQQVRTRVGLAPDWDENVEDRTEDFWTDERGWETNQRPGGAALGGDADAGSASSPDGGESVSSGGEPAGDEQPSGYGSAAATGGWAAPSASISGDDGTAGSGAQGEAGNTPWAGGSTGGSSTTGSTWAEGASEEGVGSTGGVGYDPDSSR